jgi:hypothetical protein
MGFFLLGVEEGKAEAEQQGHPSVHPIIEL